MICGDMWWGEKNETSTTRRQIPIPGAVTPLGLLNDAERKVTLYLDAAFADSLIGIHPNDNTATVWLQGPDLVKVIEDHGNTVNLVEID